MRALLFTLAMAFMPAVFDRLLRWEQRRFVVRARFHVAFDGERVEVNAAHTQPEMVACIEARMQRLRRSLRRGPPVSGELSFGPARSTLFLRHDAPPQGR